MIGVESLAEVLLGIVEWFGEFIFAAVDWVRDDRRKFKRGKKR
jgi:hypothetical protein